MIPLTTIFRFCGQFTTDLYPYHPLTGQPQSIDPPGYSWGTPIIERFVVECSENNGVDIKETRAKFA